MSRFEALYPRWTSNLLERGEGMYQRDFTAIILMEDISLELEPVVTAWIGITHACARLL